MQTQLSLNRLSEVVYGATANPRDILGPHDVIVEGERALSVRGFFPGAKQVWLVDLQENAGAESVRPMRRLHPSGVYEGLMKPQDASKRNYRIRVSNSSPFLATKLAVLSTISEIQARMLSILLMQHATTIFPNRLTSDFWRRVNNADRRFG